MPSFTHTALTPYHPMEARTPISSLFARPNLCQASCRLWTTSSSRASGPGSSSSAFLFARGLEPPRWRLLPFRRMIALLPSSCRPRHLLCQLCPFHLPHLLPLRPALPPPPPPRPKSIHNRSPPFLQTSKISRFSPTLLLSLPLLLPRLPLFHPILIWHTLPSTMLPLPPGEATRPTEERHQPPGLTAILGR